MYHSILRLVLAPLLAALVLASCDSTVTQHDISIRKWRANRYDFFANDPNSPIPYIQRNAFRGLSYFPFNHDAKVNYELKTFNTIDTVYFPMTNGEEQPFLHLGNATFNWQGTPLSLQLYLTNSSDTTYFIPFGDETNSITTYGGGRFMDIPISASYLDFNKAYNPYCAYNHRFVCPLPPKENYLPVEILAGEKKYD